MPGDCGPGAQQGAAPPLEIALKTEQARRRVAAGISRGGAHGGIALAEPGVANLAAHLDIGDRVPHVTGSVTPPPEECGYGMNRQTRQTGPPAPACPEPGPGTRAGKAARRAQLVGKPGNRSAATPQTHPPRTARTARHTSARPGPDPGQTREKAKRNHRQTPQTPRNRHHTQQENSHCVFQATDPTRNSNAALCCFPV